MLGFGLMLGLWLWLRFELRCMYRRGKYGRGWRLMINISSCTSHSSEERLPGVVAEAEEEQQLRALVPALVRMQAVEVAVEAAAAEQLLQRARQGALQ